MPRSAREIFPQEYFHFICRSNNHIDLFQDTEDFNKYLWLLNFYFKSFNVLCYHYVLMHTHVHLVLKLPEKIEGVGEMMKLISLKYSLYYRRKHQYEGNLWRGRYTSLYIDNERYMLGCGLYIEYNPVRAGIVRFPEDYLWSSYQHWIGGKIDLLLSEHPLEEVKQYKEIAQDYLESYEEYIKLSGVYSK